jgi:hypothetical protein
VVQFHPPIPDFIDTIPLPWAAMENTPQVSWLGVPTNPTIEIVNDEIFPPSISNSTTSVVYYTIATLINNTASLVISSTLSMSASMSLSLTTNRFSLGMSLMGMLNTFTDSQSMSQVSNIGVGSFAIPYQEIPWGGGHIPPFFPSVGSGHFSSFSPNPFGYGELLKVP